MLENLLNKFKRSKSIEQEQKVVKFYNPNIITDEAILTECEKGFVVHNCGFDAKVESYKLVWNDIMSAKLYADMLKELVEINRSKQ